MYRGTRVPDLIGAYVYGDYCSGRIWGLRYQGGSVTEQTLLVDTDLMITSFGVDQAGNLYILPANGAIHRFVAQTSATPVPVATWPGLLIIATLLAAAMALFASTQPLEKPTSLSG